MRRLLIHLYFLILLTLHCNPINAESWNSYGNYDISWYSNDADLYISTPEELAGLAYIVNNNFSTLSNQTVHLTNDIDLSGKTWVPIGGYYIFNGSIDGHGYTIYGTYLDNSAEYPGFIGRMEYGNIVNMSLNCEIESSTMKDYSGLLSSMTSGNNFENIIINGNINCISSTTKWNHSVEMGGTVGYSFNCSYKNITANVNIRLTAQTGGNSTESYAKMYIGGIVGESNKCTFTDVISTLQQTFVFGKTNGSTTYGYIELDEGGIVGYEYDSNDYTRCESTTNFNNTIYGYEADSYYSGSKQSVVYCGGIVGYAPNSKSTYTSCYGKIKKFEGTHATGSYDRVSFQVSGFGGYSSGIFSNCVAIIEDYKITGHPYYWFDTGYHTNSLLSDFGKYAPKIVKGCYINNDYNKTTSMLYSDETKFYSSTSYLKSQMNTQGFLDEMNLYCRINLDGIDNWKLEDGILTLKHPIDENTYIDDVTYDNESTENDVLYYDMNGKCFAVPLLKGVYIRKHGKQHIKVLIE